MAPPQHTPPQHRAAERRMHVVEPDVLIRFFFVPEASLDVSGHVGHEFAWAIAGLLLKHMVTFYSPVRLQVCP